MKQVFKARDLTEAHLVRGLLESHGLSTAVRGEDLWGIRGEAPILDVCPTVWVLDDSREAEARAVVRQYEAGGAGSGPKGTCWRCPKCLEQLEPQFTTCWSCGTERFRT